VQIAVNIVLLASIYALIAAGYVLVYRVSRVLNLAHGELMMLGAYGLLATASLFRGAPLLALGASVVLAGVLGLLVYAMLMRRMAGESVLAAVLVTIALGILLRGLAVLVWSAQLLYPAQLIGFANAPVRLPGGGVISTAGAAAVCLCAATYLALWGFFRASRWGVRMRAAGENPRLAAQRGIAPHGIYAFAWALATLTGGLAGMLLALDSGVDQTLATIGLKSFPAALVGGLDSLLGALAGSLIVAAAEVLAIHYIDPLLADVVPFVVLIAALMLRPWGLFGTKEELERV
jgi:branched-chain amino acid transport system permease protein